jgi:amidase
MRNYRRVLARWALPGLLFAGTFSGCSSRLIWPASATRDHAYITYSPRPKDSKDLRLAVKDLIDLKGQITTAGSEYIAKNSPPAQRDAACMAIARERKVHIVGKTNLSEFAMGTSGMNDYFGMPKNPLVSGRIIPGGSSSGSAVVVANGTADVAFGTDTAGSIRVPAACCGVYGLKTTYGLVSLKGVFPLSPKHLDTVGPMAKDLPRLVIGMDMLQRGFEERYDEAVSEHPSAKQLTVGRLYVKGTDPEIDRAIDATLAARGFRVVVLDEAFSDAWLAAKKHGNTIAISDSWLSDEPYGLKRGVSPVTKAALLLAKIEYELNYKEALAAKPGWQHTLRNVFRKVDFIALPTMQKLPPRAPFFGRTALLESRILESQNTVAVNFAGNPAIAIPIPIANEEIPYTSLQLIGPRLSEPQLVNAARLISAKPEKSTAHPVRRP